MEELVAELGSSYMTASLNVPNTAARNNRPATWPIVGLPFSNLIEPPSSRPVAKRPKRRIMFSAVGEWVEKIRRRERLRRDGVGQPTIPGDAGDRGEARLMSIIP